MHFEQHLAALQLLAAQVMSNDFTQQSASCTQYVRPIETLLVDRFEYLPREYHGSAGARHRNCALFDAILVVLCGIDPTMRAGLEFEIDGISGATRTGDGINHLLQFWLGEYGFGPFLERLAQDAVS